MPRNQLQQDAARYDILIVVTVFTGWWVWDHIVTYLLNKYNPLFKAKNNEAKRMIPVHAIRMLTELMMVCYLMPQFNYILLGDPFTIEDILYPRVLAMIGCLVYVYELVKRGSAPWVTVVHHLLTFAAAIYADYNLAVNPGGPYFQIRYLILVVTFGVGFTWPVDYALLVYKLSYSKKFIIRTLEIVVVYTLVIRLVQWTMCAAYLGLHYRDLTIAQLVCMSLASVVWGLSELYTAKVLWELRNNQVKKLQKELNPEPKQESKKRRIVVVD